MKINIAALGVALALGASVRAQDWKPADGPLVTRWAKEVSPSNALPEYPRPQLVRRDWLNLNGLWDYAVLANGECRVPNAGGTNAALWQGKILVPYPVESALSGVRKRLNPDQRLWYRRAFEVPKAWRGRRVLLHFGGVDWEARVWVNGRELGVHRGGYDAFSFDITEALAGSGAQELVVSVLDPTNTGGQPRGKQVLDPGGIMYTSSSGIWQTVWLEPVAEAHIRGLRLVPDIEAGCLRVTVDATGTVAVAALDQGRTVAKAGGAAGAELTLTIPRPKLWSPDSPHLYDLRVTLKSGRRTVDEVSSYFGLRKIAIGKDDKGVTRLMLNNAFVFQAGPLDQGFWPDGLYTAPTDAALRADVELIRKLGFNCARKHVKIEPDRWYYWCDRLGLLVWQDMAAGDNRNAEERKQFETELRQMVDGLRNHPSIILWVVFNEGWGQHDTERLTAAVKAWDPTRLVNGASGWHDRNCGDVVDMHNYPGPGSPRPEEKRAAVLGEFGGLGLAVGGHTWPGHAWGYQGARDAQGLTRGYVGLLRKAWGLRDSAGLSACIYTQITDVETECNGLATYDREVIKLNAEQAAGANRGQFLPPPELHPVAPTSQREGVPWRYTLEPPGEHWAKPEFDDSAWKQGPGGFGSPGTPGAEVRTEWKTGDIWLRRTFEWPADAKGRPALIVHHDEDVEVLINGVPAARAGGYRVEYGEMALTPEGEAAIKPGRNVMAVHCHQTSGGQYVDAGLVTVVPAGK